MGHGRRPIPNQSPGPNVFQTSTAPLLMRAPLYIYRRNLSGDKTRSQANRFSKVGQICELACQNDWHSRSTIGCLYSRGRDQSKWSSPARAAGRPPRPGRAGQAPGAGRGDQPRRPGQETALRTAGFAGVRVSAQQDATKANLPLCARCCANVAAKWGQRRPRRGLSWAGRGLSRFQPAEKSGGNQIACESRKTTGFLTI